MEDAPDEIVDAVGLRDHTPVRQTDSSKETTKIALPFADTPIIRRNQEMRKGSDGSSRRSSLGMRGRRASSLIDSGTSNGKSRLLEYNKDHKLKCRGQLYRTMR